MRPEIIEKLKKIQALAEHGVDGEKETAARMLNTLLKKHGLTIDDLQVFVNCNEYEFRYDSEEEKMILLHCYAKLVNLKGNKIRYHKKPHSKTVVFDLTESDAQHLKANYRIYKEAFQEDLELFLQAFLQKHGLTRPNDGTVEDTPLDIEVIKRLWVMIATMNDVPIPETRRLETRGSL